MPIKLCLECRIRQATYRGRCATCARDRERATHPNKRLYNSRRWQYTRRKQLHHHPLCAACGEIATDVDHITPIEQGGEQWASSNLQSLCHAHHSVKTRREQATR